MNGKQLTSIAHTYPTNFPGVGVFIYSNPSISNTIGEPWYYETNNNYYWVSGTHSFYGASKPFIALVKTGPITTGTLTPGLYAQNWDDQINYFVKINIETAKIVAPTCRVTSSPSTASLGNVPTLAQFLLKLQL